MSKIFEKPLVTVSGKKILFKSDLHRRIIQDLPQEGVDWRRRLDSNSKSVYVDVDFVDFDIDNVERSSERLSRLSLNDITQPTSKIIPSDDEVNPMNNGDQGSTTDQPTNKETTKYETIDDKIIEHSDHLDVESSETTKSRPITPQVQLLGDVSRAFFNQRLLGRPILHTYWADKTDFEDENQKSQFDEWIGQVQASTCTEWAIIIIEDGDFKTQLGTALFKSKLQSSASQANVSTSSISSLSNAQSSTSSFLDRMKKGLSTMFQNDSNSERWLTLINQNRASDNKVQESYNNFVRKFRNLIMASFSKQIELFEEQLRVQREMRIDKSWNFLSYFSMQEELAFAFEFLTLFDEALVQYDLLDALFTEYISSPNFNADDEPSYEIWTSFKNWPALCLDLNCEYSMELRKRIVDKKASLLDLRNYLFAKQCDLMLMQNQPWRVAASTTEFLQNCIREHECLQIDLTPGALTCWSFISALEVLQKCECYSCTSTMENYSVHTIDIWNFARKSLIDLGRLTNLNPILASNQETRQLTEKLISGLGQDPHNGLSYQTNEISPYARLKDALAGREQFSKHFVEISELTLGTLKHIGRKRQALLVGKELAEFYISQGSYSKAMPFLTEMERLLIAENWDNLLIDVRCSISKCSVNMGGGVGKIEQQVSMPS